MADQRESLTREQHPSHARETDRELAGRAPLPPEATNSSAVEMDRVRGGLSALPTSQLAAMMRDPGVNTQANQSIRQAIIGLLTEREGADFVQQILQSSQRSDQVTEEGVGAAGPQRAEGQGSTASSGGSNVVVRGFADNGVYLQATNLQARLIDVYQRLGYASWREAAEAHSIRHFYADNGAWIRPERNLGLTDIKLYYKNLPQEEAEAGQVDPCGEGEVVDLIELSPEIIQDYADIYEVSRDEYLEMVRFGQAFMYDPVTFYEMKEEAEIRGFSHREYMDKVSFGQLMRIDMNDYALYAAEAEKLGMDPEEYMVRVGFGEYPRIDRD